jgi:hypothetical protein
VIGSATVRGLILGAMLCALATIFLALAHSPPAAAEDRRVAKFDVSLSGTIARTRDVVADPPQGFFGACAYTQIERITFRNAKRTTAFAFVGRYGRAVFTTWSSVPNPRVPDFESRVDIPGEMTVSRSMTYADPGMVGCNGLQPTNCTVRKIFPTTLRVGGFLIVESSGVPGTYVQLLDESFPELDDVCSVQFPGQAGRVPGLFARRDLLNKRKKRVVDTDRVEEPMPGTDDTVGGSTVIRLAGKLTRRN